VETEIETKKFLVETGGTFSFQKNGRRKSDTAATKPRNRVNLTRD
jgi:hypothetical protein